MQLDFLSLKMCLMIGVYFGFSMEAVADPQIEWLDEKVNLRPSAAIMEQFPEGISGGIVNFGKTLQSDDLVVFGRVASLENKYLGGWRTKVVLEPITIFHGDSGGEFVEFLAQCGFSPNSKGRVDLRTSAHSGDWIVRGDVILVGLRKVNMNPFTKEYHSLHTLRFVRSERVDLDQITYVPYGPVVFDRDEYLVANSCDEKTDPYDYLLLRRAQGGTLGADVSFLLDMEAGK